MGVLKVTDFWRPRETYVSTDRYRPLVVHNNKFYICLETHVASEVWEDNADKFIAMSASGGGSSLVPQGNWDIAASTELGPPITTTPEYTTLYDAVNTSGVLTPAGYDTYNIAGLTVYGGDCNNIVNDFVTTKWVTIPKPAGISYSIVFLYDTDGVTDPINDLLMPIFSNSPATKKSITFLLAYIGQWLVNVITNTEGQIGVQYNANNTEPPGDVSFGYNSTTNKVYISGYSTLGEASIPNNFFNGSEMGLFVCSLYSAQLPSVSVSVTYPNQNTFPPLLQGNRYSITSTPANAIDGDLWNVTSIGTYDSTPLVDGDSVIFYNNLQKIIKISGEDISSVVNTTITTELSSNGRITNKINDIIAAKPFIEYGGSWDARSAYNGDINFETYTSGVYSNDIAQLGGTLYADSRWYGAVISTSTPINDINGTIFEFILPYIEYNTAEIFIDVRADILPFDVQTSSIKFIRFSLVNTDATGLDNTQIQLTATYSDGTGNTITTEVASFMSTVGDRLKVVIGNNSVTMYNTSKENIVGKGGYVYFVTDTPVDIYVGYSDVNNFSVSFVLTEGIRQSVLPAIPRRNKTYTVTNADFSSNAYGKLVHNNDLVTFITHPINLTEDALVVPPANNTYIPQYGEFSDLYLSDPNISSVIKIMNINMSASLLTLDISPTINIYNNLGVEYLGRLDIIFNKWSGEFNNVYIGNNYVPYSIYQIKFTTSANSSIPWISIKDGDNIQRYFLTIPENKSIMYNFIIIPNTQSGFTVKILSTQEEV